MKSAIILFTNNLRLHDNSILHQITNKTDYKSIFCVFCFDPRIFTFSKFKTRKTSCKRAKFMIESVENLRYNLNKIGQKLFVSNHKPEDVLLNYVKLHDNLSSIDVYITNEIGYEEKKVIDNVIHCLQDFPSVNIHCIDDSKPLIHCDDLPYRNDLKDLPNSFTKFRKHLESINNELPIRGMYPMISYNDLLSCPNLKESLDDAHQLRAYGSYEYIPTLHDLNYNNDEINEYFMNVSHHDKIFTGGEDNGLFRLNKWMFEDNCLGDYVNTRNGLIGDNYSSKLSPWLANGCLSPRMIYYEVKRYEAINGSSISSYWLIFELLVRDYFYYFVKKFQPNIYHIGGSHNITEGRKWIGYSKSDDNDDVDNYINRWKQGKTGIPIVDAGMRELYQTGFMSNRARQITASYLVWDMQIDWRIGADFFESHLIDYDVSSNYGNWNSIAALNGGRINHFNVLRQGRVYDPQGKYVRHWITELRCIPSDLILGKTSSSSVEMHGSSNEEGIHSSESTLTVCDNESNNVDMASLQPWRLLPHQQLQYGLTDYPRPIISPPPQADKRSSLGSFKMHTNKKGNSRSPYKK